MLGKMVFFGLEEDNIITPAINKLKKDNIIAFGPFSADSFFHVTI